MEKRNRRILMSVLGVLVCGISVGFFKRAAFGVDPYQTMMSGLDRMIPIGFGTLYVIVSAVLLLFSLVADRHYLGLATVINMTVFGYVAQYTLELLTLALPDLQTGGRLLLLLIGIVTMCFASAFYFTADLGVSVYDAIALIVSKTWKIGQFKYCRIISDLVCIAIGSILHFMAGGDWISLTQVVGIGTVITAFFMGPLIDFFNVHAAQPFLERN